MSDLRILDPCCGSRMMWFDKKDPRVTYGDIRETETILCDGRTLTVRPDVILDYRDLPYQNATFNLVVLDPPHLYRAGEDSWLAEKYGVLAATWQEDLREAFVEAFRVLKHGGVLILKWNETQIPLSRILELTPRRPLFGQATNSRATTHWVTWIKDETQEDEK